MGDAALRRALTWSCGPSRDATLAGTIAGKLNRVKGLWQCVRAAAAFDSRSRAWENTPRSPLSMGFCSVRAHLLRLGVGAYSASDLSLCSEPLFLTPVHRPSPVPHGVTPVPDRALSSVRQEFQAEEPPKRIFFLTGFSVRFVSWRPSALFCPRHARFRLHTSLDSRRRQSSDSS